MTAHDAGEERLHGGFDDPNKDYRTPAQRDRDRLLYSPAFRRLAGITQVAAAGEVHLLHNRLTHSLKVAQIARRLTESLIDRDKERAALAGLNPDVVETGGLAHDLGHPPFGHIAEDELDAILRERGGRFEGNAQTYRIVTKLAARKRPDTRWKLVGLDLTRASQQAILKYPALPGDHLATMAVDDRYTVPKAGVYVHEAAAFKFARRGATPGLRTPSSVLVDWADDVAYSTHDIEDYVRVGLIPIHDLERDADSILDEIATRFRRKHVAFNDRDLDQAFAPLVPASKRPFIGDLDSEHRINDWVSSNVTAFFKAVDFTDEYPWITISPAALYRVEILKALIRYYVISTASFAASQRGQRAVVRDVFERLEQWANTARSSLPVRLGEAITLLTHEEPNLPEGPVARAVADFIASLTEPQISELNGRLSGTTNTSMVSSWL